MYARFAVEPAVARELLLRPSTPRRRDDQGEFDAQGQGGDANERAPFREGEQVDQSVALQVVELGVGAPELVVVQGDGRGHVTHLLAGQPGAHGEVNIFLVQEVLLIESTQLAPEVSPDCERGAGDGCHSAGPGVLIGGVSEAARPGEVQEVHRVPRGVHDLRAVGQADAGADKPRVGILELIDKRGYAVRVDHSVRVREHEDRRVCVTRAEIAATGKPRVAPRPDNTDRGEPLDS